MVSYNRFSMPQPGQPEFDIWEGAPENIANLRGKALVRMREIAQANEPELLEYLKVGPKVKHDTNVSVVNAMINGVWYSRKPEVRTDLARVFIEEKLAEGNRYEAVNGLFYARAADLPLNEYGEPFVAQQYDISLKEGNFQVVLGIAGMMLGINCLDSNTNRMVKIEPEAREHMAQAWRAREARAFELYAEDVLSRPQPGWESWDSRRLFEQLMFRQNIVPGLHNEVPTELAKKIVENVIQQDLQTKGYEWMAIGDAAEAGMPADYIARLQSQLDPTAREKVKNWWDRIRTKMESIFPK